MARPGRAWFGFGWRALAGDGERACGILEFDGANDARCWRDASASRLPVLHDGRSRWTGIAVAGEHACGVQDNHSIWCWSWGPAVAVNGAQAYGLTEPRRVEGSDWLTVDVGAPSCGLRQDGSLWCWDLSLSACGDDVSPAWCHRPVRKTGGAEHWSAVALSPSRSCGVGRDHSLWCWSGASEPVQLEPEKQWQQVASGRGGVCAIAIDGGLWCSAFDGSPAFVRFGARERWTSVSAGAVKCAVREDRSLWCWDGGESFQLGRGHDWSAVHVTTSISAIRTDNTAWTWMDMHPTRKRARAPDRLE